MALMVAMAITQETNIMIKRRATFSSKVTTIEKKSSFCFHYHGEERLSFFRVSVELFSVPWRVLGFRAKPTTEHDKRPTFDFDCHRKRQAVLVECFFFFFRDFYRRRPEFFTILCTLHFAHRKLACFLKTEN